MGYHTSGKVVFGHKELGISAEHLQTEESAGVPISVNMAERFGHFTVVSICLTTFLDEPTQKEWEDHQRRVTETVESSAFVREDGTFSIGGYAFEGKTALGIRGRRVFIDHVAKAKEKYTPGEGGMDANHPVRKHVVFVLTTSTRAKRSAADANAFVDSHGVKLWELAVASVDKIAVERPAAPAEETPAVEPDSGEIPAAESAAPVAADPPAADGSGETPTADGSEPDSEPKPAEPTRGNRS